MCAFCVFVWVTRVRIHIHVAAPAATPIANRIEQHTYRTNTEARSARTVHCAFTLKLLQFDSDKLLREEAAKASSNEQSQLCLGKKKF